MAKKMKRKRRTGARLALFIFGQTMKWIFLVLLTVLILGAVTAYFGLNYAKTYVEDVIIPQAEEAQGTLNLAAYDPTLSSTIYYPDPDTGEPVEMRTLYSEQNRKWMVYDEIPENLINATVAIEDQRFWTHSGVDWKRTLGAVYYMFTGSNVQGGSTITQQLIKNLSQNDDVTVKRKVLEIFTALEFDKLHTKEETLELYLNNIYLGRSCYGIYTAAVKYFDKEVGDLDLAECASLISITNNPSLYDPYNHPENNHKRAATVIIQMYKQGYISEQEELSACAKVGYHPDGVDEEGYTTFSYQEGTATITFQDGSFHSKDGQGSSSTVYTWYEEALIDSIMADLMEEYGCTEQAASDILFSGGLSIYTYYDPEAQAIVDSIYNDPDALAGYESDSGQPLQSAITVIDNRNGAVTAISGGIGEKTGSRIWSRATDTVRQPGSSIKPISVYAPALEEGLITPYSAVDDTPFQYDENGNVWPKNSSRTYSGLTSVYTSVLKSLNTSAVKTLDLVGLQTSYDYLEQRFGISSLVSYREGANGRISSDVGYAPLALGGLTDGISTLEMAGAYAVFPRNGVYIKPHFYSQVVDSDGNVILSADEEGEAVLSEDTTYYINKMLEGVVTSGTGTAAQIPGYTVAGKTGTTTSNCDRWFCGYTHYYTAAVWIGYDRLESITAPKNPAANIFQQVMSQLVEGREDAVITSTNKEVVSAAYCTKSGQLATSACREAGCAATGYYLDGDQPTEYCELHRMVKICKDDPIGDTEKFRLAGDYCPEESVEEVAVLDYTRSGAAADVTAGDSYELYSWLQAQGTCSLHTAEWQAKMELKKTQTINLSHPSYEKKEGDPAFALNAVSVDGAGEPGGELSYQSSDNSVASVSSDGMVTVGRAGTATITITAAATEYAEPVTVTVTVTVKAAAPQEPENPGGDHGEGSSGIGDILDDLLHGGG